MGTFQHNASTILYKLPQTLHASTHFNYSIYGWKYENFYVREPKPDGNNDCIILMYCTGFTFNSMPIIQWLLFNLLVLHECK